MRSIYNNHTSKQFTATKVFVTTKSFTDPLLSHVFDNNDTEEYDLSYSKSAIEEYDLLYTEKEPLQSNSTVSAAASSIEDIYFVESFDDNTSATGEAPYSAEEVRSNNNSNANNNPNNNNNNNNPNNYNPNNNNNSNTKPPSSTNPNYNSGTNNAAPAPVSNTKSLSEAHDNHDDEDDFIKDMRAILNGEKKTAVPKQQVQQQSLQEDNDPRFQPVENKNEHQIFDKIAQSMKFANAYDLGEFDIDQRLNDFDALAEAKTKENTSKAKTTTTTVVHQPTKQPIASAASNEDFILDLDEITKPIEVAPQTQAETTSNDTPT